LILPLPRAEYTITMSDPDQEIEREERAIYIIILGALSPVVVAVLLRGDGVFDAGTTLSFLIVALGILGLAAGLRAWRARLPRARVYRRRPR
jgi:hypothetical protein